MSLDPCVYFLCTLGAPARRVLKAKLQGLTTALSVELESLHAQLLTVDIAVAPLEAAQAVAEAALNAARSVLNVLPPVPGCADIGKLTVNLSASLDITAADARTLLTNLRALLSFREELNAAVAAIENQISEFEAVLEVLEECALRGGEG